MEHPPKGGTSPGTLFKAEIAEFHLMEVRDALSKKEKAMTKCAFYVPLQAKPGKEKEVADFLRSAVPLVNAEPGTTSWFAIQGGRPLSPFSTHSTMRPGEMRTSMARSRRP